MIPQSPIDQLISKFHLQNDELHIQQIFLSDGVQIFLSNSG